MQKPKPWKPKIAYSRMKFESERLVLRPYRASDYEIWRAGHEGRREKQNKFDDGPSHPSRLTRKAFASLLARHKLMAAKNQHFVFPIFNKVSGANLGSVDFWIISKELRWANLGYMVHNQYWGNGYAPEAARAALELAFSALSLHRVEAGCEPENLASKKTAKRAGFKPEGLRRKFFADHGGIDLFVFGMNAIDHRTIARNP